MSAAHWFWRPSNLPIANSARSPLRPQSKHRSSKSDIRRRGSIAQDKPATSPLRSRQTSPKLTSSSSAGISARSSSGDWSSYRRSTSAWTRPVPPPRAAGRCVARTAVRLHSSKPPPRTRQCSGTGISDDDMPSEARPLRWPGPSRARHWRPYCDTRCLVELSDEFPDRCFAIGLRGTDKQPLEIHAGFAQLFAGWCAASAAITVLPTPAWQPIAASSPASGTSRSQVTSTRRPTTSSGNCGNPPDCRRRAPSCAIAET